VGTAAISYGPKLGLLNNAAIGEAYYDQLRPFLRGVDALVQSGVTSTSVTDPPASPSNGDSYLLIGGSLTGAWTGKDNQIAVWSTQVTDAGNDTLAPNWDFYVPKAGWVLWAVDLGQFVYFDGTTWQTGGFVLLSPTGSQTVTIPSGQSFELGPHRSANGDIEFNADTINENANGASGSWNVNLQNFSYNISFENATGDLFVNATFVGINAGQVQFSGTIEYLCTRVTSATYNVAFTFNNMIVFDATSGAITVNLPSLGSAGAGTGFEFTFKKMDASANAVTITPNAGHGDTIDGASTYVLAAQYNSVTIFSGEYNNTGGLTWFIKCKV